MVDLLAKGAAKSDRVAHGTRKRFTDARLAVTKFRARLAVVTHASQNHAQDVTGEDGMLKRILRRDAVGKPAGNLPPSLRSGKKAAAPPGIAVPNNVSPPTDDSKLATKASRAQMLKEARFALMKSMAKAPRECAQRKRALRVKSVAPTPTPFYVTQSTGEPRNGVEEQPRIRLLASQLALTAASQPATLQVECRSNSSVGGTSTTQPAARQPATRAQLLEELRTGINKSTARTVCLSVNKRAASPVARRTHNRTALPHALYSSRKDTVPTRFLHGNPAKRARLPTGKSPY